MIIFRRVENELTDNPFRPEESLFHEVDPIVEAYKRKPYPPSLPGSRNTTPVKGANQAYLNGMFYFGLISYYLSSSIKINLLQMNLEN